MRDISEEYAFALLESEKDDVLACLENRNAKTFGFISIAELHHYYDDLVKDQFQPWDLTLDEYIVIC